MDVSTEARRTRRGWLGPTAQLRDDQWQAIVALTPIEVEMRQRRDALAL